MRLQNLKDQKKATKITDKKRQDFKKNLYTYQESLDEFGMPLPQKGEKSKKPNEKEEMTC